MQLKHQIDSTEDEKPTLKNGDSVNEVRLPHGVSNSISIGVNDTVEAPTHLDGAIPGRTRSRPCAWEPALGCMGNATLGTTHRELPLTILTY